MTDRTIPLPVTALPPTPDELAELVRTDASAVGELLRGLEPEGQLALALSLPAERREPLLALIEEPELVVPLLPETELLHTLRGAGLDQSAWLLAWASDEQRQACIDVDCWDRDGFAPDRFREWVDALIEAGDDALLAALCELDDDVWVLGLCAMAEFELGGWGGGDSEDGLVWFACEDDRDTERVRAILRTCLVSDRRRYSSLVAAAINGEEIEAEELALHWRDARMSDLGFPPREQAMRAYRPLRPEHAETIEIFDPARDTLEPAGETWLPVAFEGGGLGDALRALPPSRALELLGYVLGVANALAVADRLELSDPASVPAALEKAVRGIDLGLRELAKQRNQPLDRVLSRTRPLDLFRIGVTLEPSLAALPEARGPAAAAPDDSVYAELLALFGDDAGVEPLWEPGDGD